MIDPALEGRWLELLRAGGGGREEALREMLAQLGKPLFQLCLRVAGDATDAEDAVQETFVDVLRGIAGFRGEARLTTWIFRIAIRVATRVRNRRVRRGHASFEAVEWPAASTADPSTSAQQRENAARILAAIGRLPAAQRTVLALAALDELPQTEVAAILGVPVGTVYSRLNAARARLRDELALNQRES